MSENNQKAGAKSKGRGGSRPNAGRKKGGATTKTREIADKVIAEAKGNSPLEVMLRIMEGLVEQAEQARNSEEPEVRMSATRIMMMAANVAKDAAPFIHPRLANVSVEATGDMTFTITTGVPGKDE